MKRSLRYRADGTFTIVQFTDTHFGNGEGVDSRTSTLMSQVLDAERPDLVIFTGDVIGGQQGENLPQSAWRAATAPVLARDLPWCAVFGNHDDECGASRRQLLALQQEIPGCLTRPGPSRVSGLGNFFLRIHSAKDRTAAALLCCLDSNSYAETAVGGYGWVRGDQIRWFSQVVHHLKSSAGTAFSPPVLVFLHIPLPEYNDVWREAVCLGEKNEDVCCPRLNTGLFAAMHLAGNVRGVFAGHDHTNDYQGSLHGISLCYGRATGYNSYGSDGFLRGARIIRLHEDRPDFTTWLRLEDGSRIDRSPGPSLSE
ncbi:MAG: metallophosphoesterase family protein [Desulforhopalus sp.]|nr:metallophosphoesterase family protein [Desulforhopalus sp.]